jgi:hypothetical protein
MPLAPAEQPAQMTIGPILTQRQELKEAPSDRAFMIMARNGQHLPKTGHDHG